MATKEATVRARISPDLKASAEAVLEKLGLSQSQAIVLFFSQIVTHKGLPFQLSLEENDIPSQYTTIKDEAHLKSLLGIE
ncbi:type II toxin-antitoxin system RelB/DinJ family antitoxin [Candidatus Gracilibacteria bacterium]|nr:type II toxin-antitoxin system RelB/DinJ family antitoxin [Candidatus Gracilibacteria bacterium]